jgi:pyruvate,water dikinase
MYYSTAARNLLLRLGELLVERGVFEARDDIFFITLEERAEVASGGRRDWRTLVRTRRAERERHATIDVPDTIRDWESVSEGQAEKGLSETQELLRGMPISTGSVVGPIRHILNIADWSKIAPGDIIVAQVIDPGMAPLFGIAGGLIVEMGGTLSHGAIIAREYGLPTVTNVERAMTRLQDGQRVTLDAGAGTIRLVANP